MLEGVLESNETFDPLFPIETICNRFHLVARQMRARHDNRETLHVADEYDVQDLLHALLRLYFEDIRPEEYTPSYAGGSSRMDFLLGPPANNDLDLLLCIQDFLRFQLDQSSNLAPKFNLLLWAEKGVSAHLIEVALNVGV